MHKVKFKGPVSPKIFRLLSHSVPEKGIPLSGETQLSSFMVGAVNRELNMLFSQGLRHLFNRQLAEYPETSRPRLHMPLVLLLKGVQSMTQELEAAQGFFGVAQRQRFASGCREEF